MDLSLQSDMLCELSLLFNKKVGVEEQFPEVRENSIYEKLWNHLDKRELCDSGSTKYLPHHKFLALWRGTWIVLKMKVIYLKFFR